MPNNVLLSIRPDYELATRYGASWQTQILSTGIPTIDLYGPEATAENFFSNLESSDPLIVNIFGHGGYNLILCQNDELLLQGCTNDEVLAGRIIYDLSCKAGRDLGTSAVNKGAISFLGYNEDFEFVISEGNHPDMGMLDPLKDEVAKGFFESHNAAPISYINNSNLEGSYWASQNSFNNWIKVWGKIDSQVAAALMWDRDHQVMKPFVGEKPKKLTPLILSFVPLLLIPLSKHLKKLNTL